MSALGGFSVTVTVAGIHTGREKLLGQKTSIPANCVFDLVRNRRIVLQELTGLFTALSDPFSII